MKIEIKYCINCGTRYRIQLSGHGNYVDTPRHLQDKEYCPGCKEGVIVFLKSVPKVTEIKYLPSTDYDLPALLAQEEINFNEASNKAILPLMKQLRINPNAPMVGTVRMPDKDYGYIYYSYSYPVGHPEDALIKKQSRVDIKTGNVIDHY